MTAGQLRHRVTIQTQVTTQDAIGQPSTSWTDTAAVWADIRYLSGLSAIKAGADASVSKVSIRLRYRACDAGQRIVCGDEVFNIEAVLPDSKKQWIDCVCEVVNADI